MAVDVTSRLPCGPGGLGRSCRSAVCSRLGGILSVYRGLRILSGPGKPLDLDAVHPGEHRASTKSPARDVPVPAGPLVHERRSPPFRIDSKNTFAEVTS